MTTFYTNQICFKSASRLSNRSHEVNLEQSFELGCESRVEFLAELRAELRV